MSKTGPAILAGTFRPIVQSGAFLRKETVEVLRQPRLLLVLIAAPFLVLLVFAVGYDQQQLVLRTRFVGPAGSVYESSLKTYTADLRRYIMDAGYTSDRVAAERDLARGDVDLVVVFPQDASGAVLANHQATIEVLHEKLDPIQQATIQVAAEVAVARVNAAIVEQAVSIAQTAARPFATRGDSTSNTCSRSHIRMKRLLLGLSQSADPFLSGWGETDRVANYLYRARLED